jgi:glycosyltransferase involved in cell wall biosynthesis
MKRKIFIIDSYSHKSFHEICNASILIECLSISDQIAYFSGKSALESLKYIIGDRNTSNVIFKIIPVIEKDNKIYTVLRFFLSAIVNYFLILFIEKNVIVLFNYNNIFSLPLINLLNRVLKRKIIILCHGEFEVFNQEFIQNQNIFWKVYNSIVKKYFTNRNISISERLIFLVLGDNIRNNLRKYIPNNIYKNIYSIDHSYINTKKSFYPVKRNEEMRIKIGMVGQVRKEKNITDVVLLAKRLAPEISSGKVNFLIIGTAAKLNTDELRSVGITIPEGKPFLSREEYDNRILEIDYVLFFYNRYMYQFTASGPLMDALFLEKPIISLRNNYFEYMFSKYGKFGILLDSIDEMAELIKELAEGKKLPFFDLKKIKDRLQPENIALQLKDIIKKVNFL